MAHLRPTSKYDMSLFALAEFACFARLLIATFCQFTMKETAEGLKDFFSFRIVVALQGASTVRHFGLAFMFRIFHRVVGNPTRTGGGVGIPTSIFSVARRGAHCTICSATVV